ncbi:hypothetical protein MNBD_BACTEROID01-2348 [hydrothermal vent metagenome]|uniref:Response regulatory domain-containing protein n=1 Tax=hydrothermal vent metagenome TaxID=652676 RepID=A0A3B0TT02_9ZZZZ
MQNTRNPLIFVVIESKIYNNLVVGFLKSKKYRNIMSFTSGAECINNIHLKPDIIISSYAMEDMNGLEIMKLAKEKDPEVDFFFLSAQNNVDVAVNLVKRGAYDYIVKDDKALDRLAKSIENAINVTKSVKVQQGFKIGVIGFFIILFIIILIILSLAIFFPDDFSFTF